MPDENKARALGLQAATAAILDYVTREDIRAARKAAR